MNAIVLLITVFLMHGQPETYATIVSDPATCEQTGEAVKQKLLQDATIRAAEWGCFKITGAEKS